METPEPRVRTRGLYCVLLKLSEHKQLMKPTEGRLAATRVVAILHYKQSLHPNQIRRPNHTRPLRQPYP